MAFRTFLVYLAACAVAARIVGSAFSRPGLGPVFYASAVWNPFLVSKASEVLTDLLSAALVLLAVALSLPRQKDSLHPPLASALGALFLAGLASIVRPAAIALLFSAACSAAIYLPVAVESSTKGKGRSRSAPPVEFASLQPPD